MIVIPLVAVLTAFLSGSLFGIVLAEIRARRRLNEKQAKAVADALSDTCLVDGVELPKPEDERWARKTHGDVETLDIGLVSVSLEYAVYVALLSIPRTTTSKAYAAEVWRCFNTRTALKSIRG